MSLHKKCFELLGGRDLYELLTIAKSVTLQVQEFSGSGATHAGWECRRHRKQQEAPRLQPESSCHFIMCLF